MNFYSNGKLLLTGEYLVLEGAKSLAIPTKQGQDLIVEIKYSNKGILHWKSFDLNNKIWFYCDIELPSLQLINFNDKKTAKTLQKILFEARKLNSQFLFVNDKVEAHTNLNFEQNWGLGTSSTLINNIASWAKIDAFELQFKIFGGSAYDIACAQNNTPIIYQLDKGKPNVEKINFSPKFKDNLFFIHLNKKQNSRDSIAQFNKVELDKKTAIDEISEITNQIISNKSLSEFEFLIKKHEEIISSIIGVEPIQKKLFKNYSGQIKSLGAWGGDFILATGNEQTIAYFNKRGYTTIIPFSKMIL